jgi:hypothetical protein
LEWGKLEAQSKNMSDKQYHIPRGHPCSICGYSAHSHRVSHQFKVGKKPYEELCSQCGLRKTKHRIRSPEAKRRNNAKVVYLGIDGEGQGRIVHKYVLLAASDETGKRSWHVENPNGLTTVQCLEFILSLGTNRAKLFSFAFNYDLTKILEDVDDESLYLLFRPELRQRSKKWQKFGPWPIKWNGYRLNLQGTKFTVKKDNKRVVIWDIFKFFQSKFVQAIKDWKVGEEKLYHRISTMKDKRSEFDKESQDDIRAYCLEECRCIAELARKLVDAHTNAGLKLKTFYGAGSSGAAMLNKMGIREKIRPAPEEMKDAIASAFFGGRFENGVIGAIRDPIWSYDISSAYPYQITFLPCLIHGRWEHTKSAKLAREKRTTLIRYSLTPNAKISKGSWGPFPFRTRDGSISFPASSGGGWIWKNEYLAGKRLFPNVRFEEAWIYDCDCDCQPFDKIPEYYVFRIRIGKDGPGIVVKLAVNSCYGKLAQSIGNAMFNNWIWAGLITSGTRAQTLDVAALHKDLRNMLMIATDGVKSLERLIMPLPVDTQTAETGKPLGGWEEKYEPKGVFLARPGIYFPLEPTIEEIKDVRGRGVGKGVILENWQRIIAAWEKDGVKGTATVANVSRFCGAKTSISRSAKGYNRAALNTEGRPAYGQWISRKVEMSFNPMPKRECVNRDGQSLRLRRFPKDLISVPYGRALKSREAIELEMAVQEAIEQPDCDLTEYE